MVYLLLLILLIVFYQF